MYNQHRRSSNGIIFSIILIGFAIRIACITITRSYHDPDDWEYGEIARNLVAGNAFSRIPFLGDRPETTSSHAPFYPYTLAVFYRIFSPSVSYIIIQILQAILSSLVILLIFKTTRLLFKKNTALLAACGVAVYPPLVYYSTKMTPTTFFIFLLSLTIFLLVTLRRGAVPRACFIGIVYGLTVLCNAIAFALIPVVILWSYVRKQTTYRELFLAGGVTLIVILPWTIRNYQVHRAIVPITTQLGVNLWIGNNPLATGTDYYRVSNAQQGHWVLMTETIPRAEKLKLKSMTEIQRSVYFTQRALSHICTNPLSYITLLIKKTFFFWWFSPSSINGSPIARQYRTLHLLVYIPLLALALLGLILFIWEQRPIDLTLILGVMVCISLVYILTHTGLARYRIPIELYLIICASSATNRILSTIRG